MRRVVVTGLGALSSYGQGVDTLWSNLLQNNSVLEPIPGHWDDYANYRSRVISPLPDFDYLANGFKRYELRSYDRVAMNAIVAAREAIEHAGFNLSLTRPKINGFSIDGQDPTRAGVYFGTGVGGVNSFIDNILHHYCYEPIKSIATHYGADEQYQNLHAELNRMVHPKRVDHFAVPRFMPNAPAAAVGIKMGTQGPAQNFSLACASGTAAIGRGYQDVRSGSVDLAITGGVEFLRDPAGSMFRGFDLAGTLMSGDDLPMDALNRPFDRKRSGFLFSEGGAASLILEEYEHAVARGAPIIAEICAYGETFDAHSIMSIEESGSQIRRLIQCVTADAGLSPADIDYVNAHGTGTTLNDEIESAAIESTFGNNVLVNSTKALLGHTIGASGAFEALVSVLSIANQTTHCCRNLDEPIRDLNFVRTQDNHTIETAYSQSFAFGGHNCALLFARS